MPSSHSTPAVTTSETPRQKAERLAEEAHTQAVWCVSVAYGLQDAVSVGHLKKLHAAIDAALAAEREATREEDGTFHDSQEERWQREVEAYTRTMDARKVDATRLRDFHRYCAAAIRALGRKP